MNRAGKVIALSIALTGGLWAYSYASTGDTQTYVSRSGSIDLALDGPSSFLLAQQMEDSIRVHTLDSLKLKDPNMAVLYAVIPGVVIHGSGHFYAGKMGTGAVLLGCGAAGATIFYYGIWGKGSYMAFGGFLFLARGFTTWWVPRTRFRRKTGSSCKGGTCVSDSTLTTRLAQYGFK